MSCEYCNCEPNRPLIETRGKLSLKGDFYHGIEVFVEDGTLQIIAVPDTYEPGYMEAEVKINYCPMCGEKLED